jgi:hypothetical protein
MGSRYFLQLFNENKIQISLQILKLEKNKLIFGMPLKLKENSMHVLLNLKTIKFYFIKLATDFY